MAESYSVKAILSAQDKGFKSAFGAAMKSANNLKDTITSGLGFGVMMAVGQKAFSVVAGSMSSLTKETINTSDSMQKLQQAMRFSGASETEIQRIAGATGTLKTYADKTVFSLEDVMSTFGALSANGIKDADKMTEAVGNAVAVFGGGAQEFSSVGLAFSQAMASGALHAQDWNQILNASPQLAGGLRKELAKLNPVLEKDFKGAMEEGAITADLLGQAMNNIGMTDMAKEAATSVTTFEGAMGNLEATVTSGMMNLYDSFAKSGVVDAINSFNEKVGKGFEWLAATIPKAIDKISPYWEVFKKNVAEVKNAFGSAFRAVTSELQKLTGAFGSTESINSFSDVMESASGALKSFAGFMEEHADVIAKVLRELPKLLVAYKGFKIVKSVAPFVGAFTSAIAGLAGKGISKLGSKLFGISKGQEAVGKSSAGSSKKILASAKAFMMLGAGVALISGGFFLLAKGAKAVADSGPLAVGVLAGMAGTVLALSFGFMSFLKNIKTSPQKMNAASKSFVKMAGAVALVLVALAGVALALVPLGKLGETAVPALAVFGIVIGGLTVIFGVFGKKLQESAVGIGVFALSVSAMALAMDPIAKTGTDGAIAMAAFGVVVAALVAVFAIFGTALTAAIPAMLSFGATVLMVGAGMNLASSLISALIPFVRQLGDTVSQVATSIAFSISMILSAFGDLVSTVADAVGTIVATVGNTLVNVVKTAGDVISDVVESISDGFRTITDGISGVIDAIGGAFSSVLESVADVINSIGNSAKNAGKGFKSVAEGIQIISELSIIDIAKSLGAVAIGLGEISSKGKGLKEAAAGVEVMIVSITSASTQLALFNVSLQKMGSLSVSVASGITAIQKAFAGFSIPPVDTSRITASFRSIVSSANMVAVQVSATGKNTANNYASAMAFGFRKAAAETMSGVSKIKDAAGKLATLLPKTAVQAMNGFNNAFSSGKTKAISIAKAMATSVVSAMKSAQGGAYNSGYYIGVGLANGMEASLGRVWSIAAQLAEAAEKAIRAKAKIHSPSRVSEELGEYYGDGWIGGIQRRMKEAYHVVKELVSIPAVDEPRLAVAGYGTVKDLDEGYSYNRNATYTIVVPVEVDGQEIAKVTAPYTQEELNKLEKRNNRKRGFR